MSEYNEGRRKFLKRAGSAAAAAPAMAAVISASGKAAHAGGHYGKPRGNNGWGNGFDGENPGSFQGGGVSQGGPGAGIPQNQSKPNTGGGRQPEGHATRPSCGQGRTASAGPATVGSPPPEGCRHVGAWA